MSNKEYDRHISVVLDTKTINVIADMACREKRSRARQAAIVLELGLKELQRREAERQSIEEGSTQVDPSLARSAK